MPLKRKAKGVTVVANRVGPMQARRFVRAKRRKPSKQIEKKHINSLPQELLCMVFDRLNLESVKFAARTCRKWNDIIFSSGYRNRFIFKINLVVKNPDSMAYHLHSKPRKQKLLQIKEWKKSHAETTIRAITESQRSYRTVRCETNRTMSLHNPSIFAAIQQKFGSNLSTLDLSFDGETMTRMFPWIIETIPLMPQLETLKLSDDEDRTKDQGIRPTLRSPTLKQFVLKSHFKIWLDMPQLQSFDGSLLVLDHPDDSLQPVAFPSLKHLTISVDEMDDEFEFHSVTREPTIIRLLPPIETMVWNDGLSKDEMFLAICESCTTLTDLRITGSLWLSDISVFSHLEKLPNLRSLSVGGLSTFNDSPLKMDFSSLTTLEKLAIDDSGVDSLLLPKSVKSLQLAIDNDNERSMIKTLLSRSLQLIELGLTFISANTAEDMPIETLKILPRLKHLQVLEFYGGCFEKSTFLCLQSPMERVRTLKFQKECVYTRRFLGLKEKFPDLKQVVMETDNPKRPQRSTNPDLYAASASGKKSRSPFGDSDSDSDLESDLDSFSSSDHESDFASPYGSDDGHYFDSDVEEYYRSDFY